MNALANGWGPGPYKDGEPNEHPDRPPKPTSTVEWSESNSCWVVLIRAIKDGEVQEFAIAIDI